MNTVDLIFSTHQTCSIHVCGSVINKCPEHTKLFTLS